MKRLLFIILFFISIIISAQCPLANLTDDLVGASDEFKTLLNTNEGFEIYKTFTNLKASLRNSNNIKSIQAFKKNNTIVSNEEIQTALESIKSSGTRRQAFLNALESCTDNENLINSLKKSTLASVDEIKDALNKIRDFRTGNLVVEIMDVLEVQ